MTLKGHQTKQELQREELRRINQEAEQRRHYQDLYDSAPVGDFTLNEWGKILEVNKTGASLLGKQCGALSNCYFANFLEPESADCFELFRWRIISGSAHEQCELQLKADGVTARWLQLESRVHFDGETKEVNIRLVVIEITSRKQEEERHEQELRSSEAKYRQLHENMMAAFAKVDMQGKIVESTQGTFIQTARKSHRIMRNSVDREGAGRNQVNG